MTTPYTSWLSHGERLAAVRQGALIGCAEQGLEPADVDPLFKSAAPSLTGAVDTTLRTLLVGSLLTGIPVGILLHHMHSRVKQDRNKERELKGRIQFYDQANDELEAGLANIGATQ